MKSTDYHDYVFRQGKLVGEFEDMYRNSATIPWHQDEQANWLDVRLTGEMLRDLGSYDEIHDLGCGTGHYLDLIAKKCLVPGGKGYGYDISPTACDQAQKQFSYRTFSVLDLTEQTANRKPQTANRKPQTANREPRTANKTSRLFMIRGTLWYVFPKLAIVIENIRNRMTGSDRLLVVQNFPPLQNSFIGKDVLPNHLTLIDHFSRYFVIDRHIWYEDRLRSANDNWFIGVFSLKD
jgi:SAM-dependent methyltransferase